MTIEDNRKNLAWWTETMGGFSDPFRRHWLIHQGYAWQVALHDRLVQGEPVQSLIASLKKDIADRQAYLANENNCTTRDRYGEVYPDHDLRRAIMEEVRDWESALKQMEEGEFAPTHIISTDEGGDLAHETVIPFNGRGA